ncbi:MAG: DUF4175 domain-containing protein [Melioribacteraceae bacterium]|nr:DUF4175 domain-containing protein [Melioribacteraceae bacterium]
MSRDLLKNILSRLTDVEKKENRKKFFEGLISVASGFALILLLFSAAEHFFNFDSIVRTVLFFLLVSLLSLSALVLILIPLLKSLGFFLIKDYESLAQKVGASFPQLKDELKNGIQLLTKKNKLGYSNELIEAAFAQIYEKAKDIDFAKSVDLNNTKRSAKRYLPFAIFFLLMIFFVNPLTTSLSKILNYDKEFITPPKFSLDVYPKNKDILKGESVTVSVKVKGEVPKQIDLFTKAVDETDFNNIEINPDSAGRFITEIKNIRLSLDYFAVSGEIQSDLYKINVLNPPIITEFNLKITQPSYSNLPAIVQKDNGQIRALKGSNVNIKLTSSKYLSSANLIMNKTEEKEFITSDNKAEIDFTVNDNSEYFIQLEDSLGNKNVNPVIYEINIIEDQFPKLEVISPGKDLVVNGDEQLPLNIRISDDYGFTKVLLHHRLSASAFETIGDEYKTIEMTFSKNSVEQDVFYVWDLSQLYLAVEDVVSYYYEVFDNDLVSGPKSTKSIIYNLRVPTLNELYAKADETQQESQDELKEILEESEKLKDELEKLSDKMKKDSPKLSWEEKEEIENAVERFEQLQSKVEDVQSKINEMQKELQKNELLSEKTLEKFNELQELLDELQSEEFKESLAKLQEMLEQMNRNQVQDSFEEFKMDEEVFQKSLERTVNLLKRIQIEQKMDEVVKRTEELMNEQDELMQESSESSENNDSEKLAEKQEKISEELKKLEEAMKDLQEKMNEFTDMPNEEMQKAMEEMQNQQNQEMSEKAMQQMQQNKMQQAQQFQKQITQNMQKMNQMMMNMQNQMQMQNQMEVMAEMMKIMDELLTLSKQQEELQKETRTLAPNSEQFRQNAQQQNKIQQNINNIINKMNELGQKTFSISPEMGKELGDARKNMGEAMAGMQKNNAPFASTKQGEAMGNLNQAAQMMQGAMEGMMNPSGQGGMMSLMQQMQQMSQQQMGINQMMQGLKKGGQLSQGQLEQLNKLTQEQRLVQKTLQQLNEEAKSAGQSKRLAANLEKIISEMSEVISGMETEQINDDLIKAQERILSKMLDAQRSINERDYEKTRESRSGQEIVRDSPPEIYFSTEEGQDKIKSELQKAIKEGYKKDYEELIRKYFEALQKQQSKSR